MNFLVYRGLILSTIMVVNENKSLLLYNTFGINALCKFFVTVTNETELQEIISNASFKSVRKMILGGGSNLLFTQDYDGLVIHNQFKGINIVKEDQDFVFVKSGAGESWHEFVLWSIEKGFAGVENLSLIPGNVGASPMQNIGAYGVEIKDVFHELEAIHESTGEKVLFSLSACEFGYRESVFKKKFKNQFVITSVTYKLRKKPQFNTSYGAIEAELTAMGIKELSVKAISDAVIRIRSSKLPDPKVLGNAGSFFKNPEVTEAKRNQILNDFPELVSYTLENGNYKLAAGWLIEKAGWKGKKLGNAGVHEKQALVIVNLGNAGGNEIYNLSSEILHSINEKFGVELEREVNII